MFSERPTSRTDWAVLTTALLAAVFFLTYRSSWQLLTWDEAVTLMFYRESWNDLLITYWGLDTHRPVYYALQKGWVTLTGEDRGIARLFPALVTLCMVPLYIAIARQLKLKPLPLVVLALVCSFPMFVVFGRDLRMYGLLHLVLLAGVFLLSLLAQRQTRPAWLWALFAATMAAAFYVQPITVFSVAVIGVWVLLCIALGQLPLRFLWEALLAFLAFAVLITPALLPFFTHLDGTIGNEGWIFPEVTMDVVYNYGLAAYPYPGLFKIPAALFLALGAIWLLRQGPLGLLLVSLTIGVPLAVILASLIKPIFLTRTIAFGSMIGLIVIACGVARLPNVWLRGAAVVVLAAGQIVWYLNFVPDRPHRPFLAFEPEFQSYAPESDILILGDAWREPELRWEYPSLFEGEAYALAKGDHLQGVVEPAYRTEFVPRSAADMVEFSAPGRLFVLYDLDQGGEDQSVLPAIATLVAGESPISQTRSDSMQLDIYAARPDRNAP